VDNSAPPLSITHQYDEALAHSEEAPHRIEEAPHQNEVDRDKQFLREDSYKKFIDHYQRRAEQRQYKTYQRNSTTLEPSYISIQQSQTSSFTKGAYRKTFINTVQQEASKERNWIQKETKYSHNNKNGRATKAFRDLPINVLFEWEGSGNIYGTFKKLDDTHALRLDINKVIVIPNADARAVLRE
jgi:hypothetical protein